MICTLQTPGVTNWAPRQIEEVSAAARALHTAGHAVILDIAYDSRGVLLAVRLHHYLTCRACEECCCRTPDSRAAA